MKDFISVLLVIPLFVGGIWCIYSGNEIYVAYAMVIFLASFVVFGIWTSERTKEQDNDSKD